MSGRRREAGEGEEGPIQKRESLRPGRGPLRGRGGSVPYPMPNGAACGARRDHTGRRWGKRMTSRMEWESVSSMTSLSMPNPRPPAGGMPYSMARR